MSGHMSDEDRDSLTEAVIYDDMNGGDRATFDTVEQIITRHVREALNAAAAQVEGWQEMAEWAASHQEDPDGAQNSRIRSLAYKRAARIVRNLRDQP